MSWKSMLMATAVATANPDLAFKRPDVLEITDSDANDIRELIRKQLSAFRNGDTVTAFALSSDAIQSTFGTPDRLLELIKGKYPSLMTSDNVAFGEYVITPDGIGVVLEIEDADGVVSHALYLVVQEGPVSWKVNGCMILPNRGVRAA